MPNIHNWLLPYEADSAVDRAIDAWRRISLKPAEITFVRDDASGTTEIVQTVRVEYDDTVNDAVDNAANKGSYRKVTLFGVRSHPTVTDVDIKRGDLFKHDGSKFKVVDVKLLLGEVQASAEVMH